MLPFELTGRRVLVAGHRGMVGSAVVRRLGREDVETVAVGRERVDFRCAGEVRSMMADVRPDVVVAAAATVGGIQANDDHPVDFLADNLAIALHTIQAAHEAGVRKLLFLGSTCIYPRLAPQPLAESSLLTGPLEPTNEWYAIAKIAGIKLCQAYRRQYGADFISVMPTNLYGPGDNYDLDHSHVAAALIRRFHEAVVTGADEVVVWGSGAPRREFLHVDDLADALVFILKNYTSDEIINVGAGEDLSIRNLVRMVAGIAGYRGRIRFDASKPDGTPRKLVDVSRLTALGWRPRIALADGLRRTYDDYVQRLGGRREEQPRTVHRALSVAR